jgi:predicted nucleic acid-binding protein
MIQQDAHLATPGKLPDIRIQDEDDLVILSSALNGNADLFVTGDRELLDFGKVENMEIVSPRMFWEKLKAQASQKR